ncbi:MAG: hypothetical protein KAV18_05825 [Candidatus Omnitrophica bacterium]|nr:hypothetical protein [Candidatus Omnitrophota bacterium]MCK4423570.1 hypothetical protein [Candidatus Omnitrophota bacterium]
MAQKETDHPYQKINKIFKLFAAYKIPYFIIGGAALALHGIPRNTLDVDIMIPASKETLINLFKAAQKSGLKLQQVNIVSLVDKPKLLIGQWLTFEDKKKRQLLDVFLEKESCFKSIYKRSISYVLNKINFQVVSLKDLEKMKKDSGRPIDLADLALIKELKKIKKKMVKQKKLKF